MLLLDSSVWIDISKGIGTEATRFVEMREENEDIATTGIVIQEVLQGARTRKVYDRLRESLLGSVVLQPDEFSTFERAAQLYLRARAQGVTVRKSNDCLIAAVALEHGALLVHNDRDFLALAQIEPELLVFPGRPH